MSMILFYDTETTGIPLWDKPSTDPGQPHLVQLAAALVDVSTRKVVSSIDLIVYPDGWDIPRDMATIHGISTERARTLGLPNELVTLAFFNLWEACDLRVGHFEAFDARILRIAFKYSEGGDLGYPLDEDIEKFKVGPAACTALLSQPICQLPNKDGKGGFKRPKLKEAHKFFFGTEHEDQHSARGDMEATMRVYWAIQDWNGVCGFGAE